jgi:hypothetical protein
VAPVRDGLAEAVLGVWQRWDAIHYSRIAASGYPTPELSGFHPLFPLLGGAVSRLFGLDPLVALMLVGNLAAAGALVLVYRLVEGEFAKPMARPVLLALLVFPGAFFLLAPYAESLTLLLALGAFASARRGRWGLAAGLGVAAGLSHTTSLPLTAPLAVLAVWQAAGRPLIRRLGVYAAALGPVVGNGLFLAWRAVQGFPGWAATHGNSWGVSLQPPWEGLTEIGEVIRSPFFGLSGWANLVSLLVALIAMVWWITLRRAEWAAWQAAMVIFLLSIDVAIEPLASWVRHLLILPPFFVALPGMLRGVWPRRIGLAVALGTQLYLVALFGMWVWVG